MYFPLFFPLRVETRETFWQSTKNDGYPDVQVFMATYRKAEAVVEQYNRELAEWERKAKESHRTAEKERYTPPEKAKCP